MYEKLKKLYKEGKITERGLQYWVDKGAITQDQMNAIINGDNATQIRNSTIIEEYAFKIKTGALTIDDVPVEYKDDVFLYLQQI